VRRLRVHEEVELGRRSDVARHFKGAAMTTTFSSRSARAGSATSAVARLVSGPGATIVRPSDARAVREMISVARGFASDRRATGRTRWHASLPPASATARRDARRATDGPLLPWTHVIAGTVTSGETSAMVMGQAVFRMRAQRAHARVGVDHNGHRRRLLQRSTAAKCAISTTPASNRPHRPARRRLRLAGVTPLRQGCGGGCR
jgi:hypothetical protein